MGFGRKAIIILAILFPAFTAVDMPALAQDIGNEEQARERLNYIQRESQASRAAAEEAEARSAALRDEITALQRRLVASADTLRMHEEEMVALERHLERLRDEEQLSLEQISLGREQMSGLLMALGRIRRLPPEALLARPGRPAEAAQTGILLSAILPEIQQGIADLRRELNRIRALRLQLERAQRELVTVQELMEEEEEEMAGLLDARRQEMDAARAVYDAETERVEALASEAQSVEGLMRQFSAELASMRALDAARLRAQRAKEDHVASIGTENEQYVAAAVLPEIVFDNVTDRGMVMPVIGDVVAEFGEEGPDGAIFPGIVIETRHGATIVAPRDGTVKFAGSFRRYGILLIIEHEGDEHSLLSGFDTLSVRVGQRVLGGEPVARMARRGSTQAPSDNNYLDISDNAIDPARPRLYFEFRQQGDPVDPEEMIQAATIRG